MSNKQNTVFAPKLRFPEFLGTGAWTTEKLGAVGTICTQKVGNNVCVPMSITTGVGLVSQEDKFGRVIAGDSYKNYLLLKPNEFAYNKSATKEYPEGFLTLYTGTELAAVPNSIFTCFRINDESPDVRFLNYQFSDNLHGRWIRNFIQVGARAHGSLSINDSDLMALPIPVPAGTTSVAEQQKIADCLSSLDELIVAQARKVDALKTHKNGLMQQLFPREGETQPRLRFLEFRDAGEWESKTLVDACKMQAGKFVPAADIKEEKTGDLFPCYGGNGLRGFTVTHTHDGIYPLIGRQGALCGNVKLASGQFHATEHAVVATPNQHVNVVWLYYLLDLLNLNRFATGQAQPGLSVEVLEKLPVTIPKDECEQKRIAKCLRYVDDFITAAAQELDIFKTHKKGLMQQLFPQAEPTS